MDEVLSVIGEFVPEPYPPEWIALKLLEGDSEVHRLMEGHAPAEKWELIQSILKAHDDAFLAIVSGRYEWIEHLIRTTVIRPRIGQIGLTDRLDHWLAHPFWGLAEPGRHPGIGICTDFFDWSSSSELVNPI